MIEVRAVRNFRAPGSIGLFIDSIDQINKTVSSLKRPLVFEKRELYTLDLAGPDIVLEDNSAQILMDSLWDAGIRPSEGSGSAGSFAAQGKHLEDMRRLVFKDFANSQMKVGRGGK